MEQFYFNTRFNLLELTGIKARNLEELREGIEKVPGSVIYYHTHHYLQQHQYLSPEPPNDFAYWVTNILKETILGERLASIDIYQFKTIRELRENILKEIEKYLKEIKRSYRQAVEGEEFNFIKAITFILPTGKVANNLEEFVQILKEITINSIYFHMFESRLRLEKGVNDFSLWIEKFDPELARNISRIDPYTHTMEGLRKQICYLIEKRLKYGKN